MKNFEKWFKKAESDLLTIENLIGLQLPLADVCCFHAQQASEKYLKAYLVARSTDFPKTHDLKVLIVLCSNFNSKFRIITVIASRLSEFEAATRYPDVFDELNIADAQQAYENAIVIKEFVL
jgi:HEPN domain-containing protein